MRLKEWCRSTFMWENIWRKDKFLNGYRKQAVCADLMWGGRLFQSRLPAAVKARSPTVTSLVVGMMTSSDDDDRKRRRSNSEIWCVWGWYHLFFISIAIVNIDTCTVAYQQRAPQCSHFRTYLSSYANITTLCSSYIVANPSVCLSVCLSVVCDVGAPYADGWIFTPPNILYTQTLCVTPPNSLYTQTLCVTPPNSLYTQTLCVTPPNSLYTQTHLTAYTLRHT